MVFFFSIAGALFLAACTAAAPQVLVDSTTVVGREISFLGQRQGFFGGMVTLRLFGMCAHSNATLQQVFHLRMHRGSRLLSRGH